MKYILLLLSLPCLADTFNVKYGLGVLGPVSPSKGDVGLLEVGHQAPINDSLDGYTEFGGYTDKAPNRSSSLFASTGLGIHIHLPYLYAESLHGIGFIMAPDSMLGGQFQFFHSLGFGIKDYTDSTLGIEFKHISSAGINRPNIGRNFVLVKIALAYE